MSLLMRVKFSFVSLVCVVVIMFVFRLVWFGYCEIHFPESLICKLQSFFFSCVRFERQLVSNSRFSISAICFSISCFICLFGLCCRVGDMKTMNYFWFFAIYFSSFLISPILMWIAERKLLGFFIAKTSGLSILTILLSLKGQQITLSELYFRQTLES